MDLSDALPDQKSGQWPGGQPGGQWPGGQPGGQWPGGQPAAGQWPGGQPAPGQWPGQPGPGQWPGQPGGQPGQPAGNSSWPGQPDGNSSWPPSQPASNPSWQPGQPGPNPWSASGGGCQPGPQPSGPGGWPSPAPGPGPAPAPTPSFPVAPQQSLTVPYSQNLPNGVYDKQLIVIAGRINPNADKITVDLMQGRDVAFHFTVRFNEGGKQVIVRNSRLNNKWGKEERDIPRFPFTKGRPFEMKILCTNNGYKVGVDGSHLLEFQHRTRDLKSIRSFNIHQDLTLSSVRLETIP